MHDGIINGDHLTGIFQRTGHENLVAHRIAYAIGNRGFPVARRPIHQDRAARADSGAKVAQQIGRQDQVAHGIGQLVAGDGNIADRLAFDLFAIHIERHRHGTVIFGLGKGIKRTRLALIGQLIAHFIATVIGVERACRLEQAFTARGINQFLRDGDGQADGAGQFRGHGEAFAKDGFEQDIPHHGQRKLHILERFGRRRGFDALRRGRLHIHGRVPFPSLIWP